MITSIDWSQTDCEWWAMDPNGNAYFYENRPRKDLYNQVWQGGEDWELESVGNRYGIVDWERSLTRNPGLL